MFWNRTARIAVLGLFLLIGPLSIRQSAAPVAGGQSIGDPYTPELGNTGYDVTHYDLALKFDLEKGTLDGLATLSADATLDNLGSLTLDFVGLTVSAVMVDGQPAHYEQQDAAQKLLITLPKPLAKGTTFKMAITYGGQPKPFESRYISFLPIGLYINTQAKRVFVVDEPDGAHSWFPCNDHPLDRATYTFHLTVGAGLMAIANGQQQGDPVKNADGSQTYNWDMPQTMASYLATIEIGNYVAKPLPNSSPIPLTVYTYQDKVDDAVQAFQTTGDLMNLEIKLFGPFPFDSYGQVIVNQQDVGMESQTMTVMPDGMLKGNPTNNVLIIGHEMAHHWFGDSVALKTWADIWLNEGFASYAEYLSVEGLYGKARANRLLDGWERAVQMSADRAPVAAPEQADMFGTNTYLKGGFVLHMLREQIGDAAFFKTLQSYAARYKYGNATTADFQAIAEEVSGQSLAAFFDEWLRRAGLPRLTISWTDRNGQIDALVCQRSDPPFTLTLPVTLSSGTDAKAKTEREQIDIAKAETRAHFSADFDVTTWTTDPDQNVLASATVKQVDALPASCSS